MSATSLQAQVLATLRHELRVIQPYLDDPQVQEVMINHPGSVFIERAGQTEQVDVSFAPESLHSLIVTLSNANDKSATSLLDARLPGLRLAATLPPVAVHGPAIAIRRHSSVQFTFEDYIRRGAFTPTQATLQRASARLNESSVGQGGQALADWLLALVRAKINFVITGSTSSGKTAFLNMLAQHIGDDERVVTIEDTQELQIRVPNWLALEANPTLGVDVRALVRHALRNRPNRILVGEARGSEFFDILDAYNTGHPGSAVTFHSNSAAQALPRLENMIRMAPEASNWPLHDLRAQIAATFGYVIHCANVNGVRGPVEILAIRGCESGQYLLESVFRRQ